MDSIDPEIEKVARALCAADRQTPDYRLEIQKGFTIPHWLVYVSEANRLLRERDAMKSK